MKSNTLVIATLAWTAGIVGCIDEHRACTKVVSAPSSSLQTVRCATPVVREQVDIRQMEALSRVPIFVGGDKVTEVRGKGKTEGPVVVSLEMNAS